MTKRADTLAFTRRQLIAAGSAAALAASLPGAAFAQTVQKLKIGVIGAGHIGGTVGGLWIKAAHPVMFATRNPAELKDMVAGLGSLASAGTDAQAIAYGDVVFIAIPYGALPQFAQENGATLKGKIVLDAENVNAGRDGQALADEVAANGVGITSQKYLAGAHVVRAFNTLGYHILADAANRAPPRLAIPIAGDTHRAVHVAAHLVRDAGFDPVIVGGLASASRFQTGGPGYGQNVTAPELKKILGLKP
jgi:predicted dinucleotide-binding enzyme